MITSTYWTSRLIGKPVNVDVAELKTVVVCLTAAYVLRGIGDGAAVAAGRFTCVGCAVVETYLHTSVLAHRV